MEYYSGALPSMAVLSPQQRRPSPRIQCLDGHPQTGHAHAAKDLNFHTPCEGQRCEAVIGGHETSPALQPQKVVDSCRIVEAGPKKSQCRLETLRGWLELFPRTT